MASGFRMSAAERRTAVLLAARIEFGEAGYAGTSTESIARRVGVSQPYLFRLFPSKKAIFLATVDDCFDRLTELFDSAARDRTGEEALAELGRAYRTLLDDRSMLRMQLQMWAAACHDQEIRRLAGYRLGRTWQQVKRLSGADEQRVMQFMASGMLLNVSAALDLPLVRQQLGQALTGLSAPPALGRAGDVEGAA